MDRKQKLLVKSILLFFLVCIVGVIIIGFINNRKLSYVGIENKLVSAAKVYYKDHANLLPQQDGGSVSVDSLTLIENEYMKEFEKYKKDAISCSATVTVTNNNGYYLYLPDLKCQDFKTTSIYHKIVKDNPIVTEKDGLYDIDGEYVFRGEYPNNYVEFAGKNWRILRLTRGNEIRLISVDSYQERPWDNRYNVSSKYSSGITEFEISRIKETLNGIYKKSFNNDDKSYIVSKQLCIGSRNKKATKNDGSVECSKLTEESYPIGMIQVNEYVLASIDANCKVQTNTSCINYNYLRKLDGSYWTITPSSENNYDAYYVSGSIKDSTASEYRPIRITLNIDGNVVYKSGSGTKDNPYVIS